MLSLLLLVAVTVEAKDNNQWFPDKYPFKNFNDNICKQDPASGDVPICYADEFEGPITNNAKLVDSITKFNRERIPERVVHAKGVGAFGYFEVTHDISHICEADFLESVGKRTPVGVRFSAGTGERGSSDLFRDARGFAVKFYTKEGNLDLVGFHTEMIFNKDPLQFSSFVHAVKRMPETNLYDFNPYWDIITLKPESLNFFVNLYANTPGIPCSYRHMAGFPIHTFQVKNKCGIYSFVRFHVIPNCGIKTLNSQDAMMLGAADPDYLIRDLCDAISKGDFPSWTVSVQILSMKDVKKYGSKVFDVTRKLNIDEFPLHPVGQLVLNKNAKNDHDEIEPMAFCPCNLVPGILGAPDKMFESRTLAYRDTQLYRLGKNHNKIPVNCPLHKIFTYNRDGMPPVGNNDGNAPNYYPNSYNGPQPRSDRQRHRNCTRLSKGNGLIDIIEEPANNTDQVVEFYNELTKEGRQILCENVLLPLRTVTPRLQNKVVKMFTSVIYDLGRCLAKGLSTTSSNSYY